MVEVEIIKDRFDSDGNPVTLYSLVRSDPDWAASRIKWMENELADCKAELARVKAEVPCPDCECDGVVHRDLYTLHACPACNGSGRKYKQALEVDDDC